jgi:nucleotide-binding universal stress UspA family protein
LHVVNPIESLAAISTEDGTPYEEILDMPRNQAETLLEAAREQAAEHGVDIETEFAVGDVVRSIIEFVDDHGVDHVVIGSHGRTGVSRVVLGSVAEMVTRRAPVPVTVVR